LLRQGEIYILGFRRYYNGVGGGIKSRETYAQDQLKHSQGHKSAHEVSEGQSHFQSITRVRLKEKRHREDEEEEGPSADDIHGGNKGCVR
jgi:hypothetical protein